MYALQTAFPEGSLLTLTYKPLPDPRSRDNPLLVFPFPPNWLLQRERREGRSRSSVPMGHCLQSELALGRNPQQGDAGTELTHPGAGTDG